MASPVYATATTAAEPATSPRGIPTTTSSRVNQACASCRRKKVRCDGVQPSCSNCISRNIACTYLAQRKRGRPPKSQQPRQSSAIMPYYTPVSANNSNNIFPISSTSARSVAPATSGTTIAFFPPPTNNIDDPSQLSPTNDGCEPMQITPNTDSASTQQLSPQSQQLAFQIQQQQSASAFPANNSYLGTNQSRQPYQSIAGSPTTDAHDSSDCLNAESLPASNGGNGDVLQPMEDVDLQTMDFSSLQQNMFAGLDVVDPNIHLVTTLRDRPDPTSMHGGATLFNSLATQLMPFINSNYSPLVGGSVQSAFPLPSDTAMQVSMPSMTTAPLTVPPNMSYQQNYLINGTTSSESTTAAPIEPVSTRKPTAPDRSSFSFTLGNVALAMSKKEVDKDCIQNSLSHLQYVTKNISTASQEALVHAREIAAADAEAMSTMTGGGEPTVTATNQTAVSAPANIMDMAKKEAHIHESLIKIERRPELANKAVHNYFCYIHHQCPIIHKPTFIRQISIGSVNHFVWLAMRALSARTLQHSHMLSEDEILIEEEYFASKAQKALSSEISRPSAEVIQGLALFALYIFGTPQWQQASMYWSQATRLAQLLEYHIIDAPLQAISTKLHFGIFEPHKRGTAHMDDLALIPGDFSGYHVPLAQKLTPLEAELRRRIWWILFTNERFCAIAERLPTMVNEARMFVHFPCSAQEWDQQEFTYKAPDQVPRYLREGYTGDDRRGRTTLSQEMSSRKSNNIYLMSEIEYGFSISHLVAFFSDMGALFRPRYPYGNDYIPMFMQVTWPNKMKMLRGNVERVERIIEMVRTDIVQRLAMSPNDSNHWKPSSTQQHPQLRKGSNTSLEDDPVLNSHSNIPGIEIPHLHQLGMLILYTVLNIHLYRMVFQIHYEFSSSLPEITERKRDDVDLLAAFDQYVKDLWLRATTAAQQVSQILRGEFPGLPQWILKLAGIRRCDPSTIDEKHQQNGAEEVGNGNNVEDRSSTAQRMRTVFQQRIRAKEARLHEVALSVFASFRRTLPYALLLTAKVHVDNIAYFKSNNNNNNSSQQPQDLKLAHAYRDLSDVVQFLETHQVSFSSTDYVSLVKGMMNDDDLNN